jgi:probable HAF family extracellular repeat protein
MNIRKVIFSLAALWILSVPLLAQGTYTQIDYPGGTQTLAIGINTAGDVVGTYTDGLVQRGFLLSGGGFTTIDYPDVSKTTILFGINDVGQIVGYTGDATIGFSYDIQAQTFTRLQYSPSTQTLPDAVNNAGTIVGLIQNPTSGVAVGFELNGTIYTTMKAPGALRTVVTSVNNSGQALVVGDYVDGSEKSYILDEGKLTRLQSKGNHRTAVVINDNGAIAGTYVIHETDSAGFLTQNNTSQQIRFPGSHETFVYGINDAGVVVGFFYDSVGNEHGFIWTPPADAEKK